MAIDVNAIVKQILGQAAKQGGTTWTAIQKSAPLYIKGYATNLADIAEGVLAGQIPKASEQMHVRNAQLLLVMGIANTSQIVLNEVQVFIDDVIEILKGAINKELGVSLL